MVFLGGFLSSGVHSEIWAEFHIITMLSGTQRCLYPHQRKREWHFIVNTGNDIPLDRIVIRSQHNHKGKELLLNCHFYMFPQRFRLTSHTFPKQHMICISRQGRLHGKSEIWTRGRKATQDSSFWVKNWNNNDISERNKVQSVEVHLIGRTGVQVWANQPELKARSRCPLESKREQTKVQEMSVT